VAGRARGLRPRVPRHGGRRPRHGPRRPAVGGDRARAGALRRSPPRTARCGSRGGPTSRVVAAPHPLHRGRGGRRLLGRAVARRPAPPPRSGDAAAPGGARGDAGEAVAGRPRDHRVGPHRRAPLLAVRRHDDRRGRAGVDGHAGRGHPRRGSGAPDHHRNLGPGDRVGPVPGGRGGGPSRLRLRSPLSDLPGGDLPGRSPVAADDPCRRLRDGPGGRGRPAGDGPRVRCLVGAVRPGGHRRLRPAALLVELRARSYRVLRVVLDRCGAGRVPARPLPPAAPRDAVRCDRLARGAPSARAGARRRRRHRPAARPRRVRVGRTDPGCGGDGRPPRVRPPLRPRRLRAVGGSLRPLPALGVGVRGALAAGASRT